MQTYPLMESTGTLAKTSSNKINQSDMIAIIRESLNRRFSLRKIKRVIKSYEKNLSLVLNDLAQVQRVELDFPQLCVLVASQRHEKLPSIKRLRLDNKYLIEVIGAETGLLTNEIKLIINTYYDNVLTNLFLGKKINFMSLFYIHKEDEHHFRCMLTPSFVKRYKQQDGLTIRLKNKKISEV